MEKLSISDLPKGTKKALGKLAIKANCKTTLNKPNLAEYMRTVIADLVAK